MPMLGAASPPHLYKAIVKAKPCSHPDVSMVSLNS